MEGLVNRRKPREKIIGLIYWFSTAMLGLGTKANLKTKCHLFPDGWTTNDLIYRWKDSGPVQKTANLSLPGGFKLDGIGDKSCDVITATGKKPQDILYPGWCKKT